MKSTLERRAVLALAGAALGTRARAAEPVKIVFVDTGNTGRSLMAEVLARTLARRRGLAVAVISRGLDVDPFDAAPEPNARRLMKTRGIDVSGHEARGLAAGDVAHADVVLTMTAAHAAKVTAQYPEARAKVFTLAAYAGDASGGDVPDAWG
jgi:protein-tyrosine phosphatase